MLFSPLPSFPFGAPTVHPTPVSTLIILLKDHTSFSRRNHIDSDSQTAKPTGNGESPTQTLKDHTPLWLDDSHTRSFDRWRKASPARLEADSAFRTEEEVHHCPANANGLYSQITLKRTNCLQRWRQCAERSWRSSSLLSSKRRDSRSGNSLLLLLAHPRIPPSPLFRIATSTLHRQK